MFYSLSVPGPFPLVVHKRVPEIELSGEEDDDDDELCYELTYHAHGQVSLCRSLSDKYILGTRKDSQVQRILCLPTR